MGQWAPILETQNKSHCRTIKLSSTTLSPPVARLQSNWRLALPSFYALHSLGKMKIPASLMSD